VRVRSTVCRCVVALVPMHVSGGDGSGPGCLKEWGARGRKRLAESGTGRVGCGVEMQSFRAMHRV
jgi:hypothetical protein